MAKPYIPTAEDIEKIREDVKFMFSLLQELSSDEVVLLTKHAHLEKLQSTCNNLFALKIFMEIDFPRKSLVKKS